MNARLQPHLARRAMTTRDLDTVLAVETSAYRHPWSRANFIDSLAAGYLAEVLQWQGQLAGYFVAMVGVDELHLLNVTVAPAQQSQGLGQWLLDAVQDHGCRLGLSTLLLEVRRSNTRAQALYLRRGFAQVGERRGYYPASQGREDALVMSLKLGAPGAPWHVVD